MNSNDITFTDKLRTRRYSRKNNGDVTQAPTESLSADQGCTPEAILLLHLFFI